MDAVAVCSSFSEVEWNLSLKRGRVDRFFGQSASESNIDQPHQQQNPYLARRHQHPHRYNNLERQLDRDYASEWQISTPSQESIVDIDDDLCDDYYPRLQQDESSDIADEDSFVVAESSRRSSNTMTSPTVPPYNFTVGYALTAKKIRSFLQPSLEAEARRKGIVFKVIDYSKPLDEQGYFDLILHKITGEAWHRQLKAYKQNNPEVMILDPPDAIKKVYNRQSMLLEVASLGFHHPQGQVMVPRQLVVDGDPVSISYKVGRSGLKFPLVAKPKWIDGTAKSHALSLAFNETSLSQLTPPLVLQEFVNHGGILFKVYIIGHHVKVVRRFSLPDVLECECKNKTIIPFPRVSCAAASADGANLDPVVGELPPKEMLEALGKQLRHKLGLSLFNLDMIREGGKGNTYYVIDINYFPGYGKVPGYENVFTEFLSSLADNKMSKSTPIWDHH